MITPNQHGTNQYTGDIRPLAKLEMGGRGRVVRVTGTGKVSHRLLEMGITPGAEICLLRAAPLGDPLEIEIRGYRLSLRRSEAEKIDMETW
jgi:Fe2+ transport system protein FeoA